MEISRKTKRCPGCNKRITHPYVTFFSLITIIIAIILVVGIANDSGKNVLLSKNNNTNPMLSFGEDQKTIKNDNANRILLVNDEKIEAYFLGFEDYSSVDASLSDCIYLTISVKNKMDKKIWVTLEDASLNNETMQAVFSGVPLTVLPSQTGTNSFIFPFKQVSIKSYDEVEKASFKIKVYDDDTMKIIETTPTVTVKK